MLCRIRVQRGGIGQKCRVAAQKLPLAGESWSGVCSLRRFGKLNGEIEKCQLLTEFYFFSV